MASDLLVKIGGDTSEFKESLAGLGHELLTTIGEINPVVAGVVGTIAGIGIAAVDSGLVFEEAYNTIIAKTGATGDKLNDLKESFDTVFTSVPVEAEAAAQSIGLISDRLHLTGEDLTNLTTQIAQLSLMTGSDMVANTDAITKAFQNWNVATEDQKDKLDFLNSVAQQTGTSVTTLAGSMAEIGNIARLSGESFEQTATQIGVLESKGIDAQTMFAGISKAMAQARKDGTDLSDVTMPNLVFSIEEGIKSGNGLNVALDEFGNRAGAKMYQLVKDGIVSSAELMTKSFGDSKDSIEKTYAATDTFGRQLTILKDNLMAFLSPLGEWIVGGAKDFLSWLNTAVVGVESIYYAMTGNDEALKKLTDSYDKANPKFQDATTGLQGNKAASDALAKTNADLGITIVGVGNNLKDLSHAHEDHAAAVEYDKQRTELLNESQKVLDEGYKQNAADMKALYVPVLMDVATAEAQLVTARTESKESDDNLVTAEQALQKLLDSHKFTNTELKDAEDAVTLAKNSAADANVNLSETEKNVTTAKTADRDITNLLLAANKAIADALKTDYVPAAMSLVDAEVAVNAARTNTQAAIQAEKDAAQALSDFQNQVGVKDLATEKDLKDKLATATQNLTDTRNKEGQAIKDASTIKQASIALDNDILTNTKLLDSFMKDNVFATQVTLQENLTNIQVLRQKQIDDAAAVQAALQTENDLRNSGVVDIQAETDARLASKAAQDAYKTTTDQLNTSMETATKNYGLSKDAIILLTTNVKDATTNAPIMQAAYNDLGIKTAQQLKDLAAAADQAFKDILASGTTSADTLLKAQIADLTAQAEAIKATGDGSVPAAMQIQLAALKTKQGDFITDSQTQWGNLYTGIDGTLKTFASSAINTLFTGKGSFKEEGIAALQSIGEEVVTTFTKKATDAVASFISGAITDLLSGKGLGGVLDTAHQLETSLTNVFKTTGDITSGASSAGSAAGQAGSTGSSAGSAAGSAVGGIAGVVTAVSSVITAISGIIGNIQNITIEGKLAKIEENTRSTAFYTGGDNSMGGILHAVYLTNEALGWGPTVKASELIRDYTQAMRDTLNGMGSDSSWTLKKVSDVDYNTFVTIGQLQDISKASTAIASNTQWLTLGLQNIAMDIIANKPVVNITNVLDGKAIAGYITTAVEAAIKQAT